MLYLLLLLHCFKFRTHPSTSPPLWASLTYVAKSNLTLWLTVAGVQCSPLFMINTLVSGNYCAKDFVCKPVAEPTEGRAGRRTTRSSLRQPTVFSHASMPGQLVQWWRDGSVYSPAVRGWMCLRDKKRSRLLLLLMITSSKGSDEDFIQHTAYGFWQVCDGGVIRARGPWKQLLWARESAWAFECVFIWMARDGDNWDGVCIPVSGGAASSLRGQRILQLDFFLYRQHVPFLCRQCFLCYFRSAESSMKQFPPQCHKWSTAGYLFCAVNQRFKSKVQYQILQLWVCSLKLSRADLTWRLGIQEKPSAAVKL